MLRQSRRIVSIVVLSILLSGFALEFERFPWLLERVFSLQFTPSLIKAIGGSFALGFLAVIVLTLLFGRVYCGCLCPLGIFQDAVLFLLAKTGLRKTPKYQQPLPVVRYGFLAVFILSLVSGSLLVVNLLDPFSSFGRIAAEFFIPPFVWLYNSLVNLAADLSLPGFWSRSTHPSAAAVGLFNFVFLVFLFVMIWLGGRIYCNTICPVGTLLGMLSRFSLYRIAADKDDCRSCSLCEKSCRAGCIDGKSGKVDMSRCVMCFDCLSACPGKGLKYERVSAQAVSEADPSRRRFVISSMVCSGAILASAVPLRVLMEKTIGRLRTVPITPPGSRSVQRFLHQCIGCHLCVTNCPTKVIKPAFDNFGARGIMQPALSFEKGHCEYDCTVCGQVCPSGAIEPLTEAEKRRTQIGQVHYFSEECVVEKFGRDCGACAEVCPTRAVYTVERNGLYFPETDVDLCIGCGHCEYACPTFPKAIVVFGKEVHGWSKHKNGKRRQHRLGRSSAEDFPF